MLKNLLRSIFEKLDNVFDAFFGGRNNPLHQLGGMGWFFYWIVASTGIYLYIFLDTGVAEAYESVERLTHQQWYAGGFMRSLHRYASDGLVIVVLLHLAREFAMDRLRGVRWFAWFTGVPLLWFLYASGISGYWLVWDKLAQYIAVSTTEWLDTLPFFGAPVARNFLSSEVLSGRFFTLMVYIHIAVPLVMLLLMWMHITRHSGARVNPPRSLAIGTLAMLTVLSAVRPALSQGPADLDKVVSTVNLDWFYLALYPLLDTIPGGWLWLGLFFATLLLALLPWIPAEKAAPVAVVDLANCNGCARCAEDCPYEAIRMEPRSDGSAYKTEAVVDAELCSGCGICAGACPTATPFRRATRLVAGIELPDLSMELLREKVLEACAAVSGPDRILVFGCRYGASFAPLNGEAIATVALPCVAALPPSFIDFVISRKLADGVVVAGCGDGDCFHRLGLDWTQLRLDGKRDPYLRKRVPRERLLFSMAGKNDWRKREQELAAFRDSLSSLGRDLVVRQQPGAPE